MPDSQNALPTADSQLESMRRLLSDQSARIASLTTALEEGRKLREQISAICDVAQKGRVFQSERAEAAEASLAEAVRLVAEIVDSGGGPIRPSLRALAEWHRRVTETGGQG